MLFFLHLLKKNWQESRPQGVSFQACWHSIKRVKWSEDVVGSFWDCIRTWGREKKYFNMVNSKKHKTYPILFVQYETGWREAVNSRLILNIHCALISPKNHWGFNSRDNLKGKSFLRSLIGLFYIFEANFSGILNIQVFYLNTKIYYSLLKKSKFKSHEMIDLFGIC